MPTATDVRTVSVTCACGVQFDREVKRGRPQVWCPSCLDVPFYDRVTAAPVVKATVEADAPAMVIVRVESTDKFKAVRDQIEAGVADVYSTHEARFQARVAEGLSNFDAGCKASLETGDLLRAVYAKFKPAKD